MSLAISVSEKPERKFSTQMRAVLLIFGADKFLMESVTPFINFDTETIHWDQICKVPFGAGHRAAVTWAYGVWTDEPRPRSNCFDAALSMSPSLQAGVLKALVLRWGL